jgi:hypothetical protein
MRSKLKYILPPFQMAFALALMLWDQQWQRRMRLSDMPGPSPAFTFLTAINFPAAILRMLWFQHLPDFWDALTFILAIGLLWYWVSLNLGSWRERRTVSLFSWTPLRVVTDFILLSGGAFYIFDFFRSRRGYMHWWGGSQWASNLIALAWCVVLVLLFGRDLLQNVRRRGRVISGSNRQP